MEVHGGLEHVRGGDEEPRVVSVVPEDLCHGDLVLGNGLPPRDEHGVPLREDVVPAGEGTHPRVHRPSHRDGGEGLRVGVHEPHSFGGEGIDVRGLDPVVPVGPHVIPPEAVQHDENYVRQGKFLINITL